MFLAGDHQGMTTGQKKSKAKWCSLIFPEMLAGGQTLVYEFRTQALFLALERERVYERREHEKPAQFQANEGQG